MTISHAVSILTAHVSKLNWDLSSSVICSISTVQNRSYPENWLWVAGATHSAATISKAMPLRPEKKHFWSVMSCRKKSPWLFGESRGIFNRFCSKGMSKNASLFGRVCWWYLWTVEPQHSNLHLRSNLSDLAKHWHHRPPKSHRNNSSNSKPIPVETAKKLQRRNFPCCNLCWLGWWKSDWPQDGSCFCEENPLTLQLPLSATYAFFMESTSAFTCPHFRSIIVSKPKVETSHWFTALSSGNSRYFPYKAFSGHLLSTLGQWVGQGSHKGGTVDQHQRDATHLSCNSTNFGWCHGPHAAKQQASLRHSNQITIRWIQCPSAKLCEIIRFFPNA